MNWNRLYWVVGIVVTAVVVWAWILKKSLVQKTWSAANDAEIKKLHPIIQPAVADLINRLERKHGIRLKINSGFRTSTEQEQQNPNLAAPVGLSLHEYGLAVDFKTSEWPGKIQLIEKEAKDLGFKWGGDFSTNKEPWHFYKDFGYKSSEFLAMREAGKFAIYPQINLVA